MSHISWETWERTQTGALCPGSSQDVGAKAGPRARRPHRESSVSAQQRRALTARPAALGTGRPRPGRRRFLPRCFSSCVRICDCVCGCVCAITNGGPGTFWHNLWVLYKYIAVRFLGRLIYLLNDTTLFSKGMAPRYTLAVLLISRNSLWSFCKSARVSFRIPGASLTSWIFPLFVYLIQTLVGRIRVLSSLCSPRPPAGRSGHGASAVPSHGALMPSSVRCSLCLALGGCFQRGLAFVWGQPGESHFKFSARAFCGQGWKCGVALWPCTRAGCGYKLSGAVSLHSLKMCNR